MDCSSPGSSVHGILQARILEWVAMPSAGDLRELPRVPLRGEGSCGGGGPVVMYGCESWTVKKAEHQRIDAFEL